MPAARRSAVLALVVAGALAACGTGAPGHVRLGVLAPLTGPRAFLGHEVANGAELAVAELNRRGGLLGEDVELVVVDDASLVDLPGQLADLAEVHRVSAVIGPETAGVLTGPRSPLSRRDVPALLPTAFAGDLDEASTFVARTVPSAAAQAERLGSWLTDVRRADAVAVLVVDPVEGAAAGAALRQGFDRTDLDVAVVAEADGEASQLGPAVAQLRRRAPDADAVLLWGPPPATARATLAVRELGWDVQIAVPASSFVAEYRTLTGAASEGVVLAFPFRQEWFGARLTSWMLSYHAAHGIGALPGLDTLVIDLPVAAAAAYDAVMVAADAVQRADSREPAAVARTLPEVETDGVLRVYDLADREAYTAEDLYVARFAALAVVYDADPRLDADAQRRFWQAQVSAEFLPAEALAGPAGALLRSLLEARRDDVPRYVPPLPPPGPVGHPGTDR
ncbi:MAG: ABC transporter substrate-binding protein [Actinobacteria bacterium]|nr:ABC transporter substrate-binding protein [Actinomycetota bacterium]